MCGPGSPESGAEAMCGGRSCSALPPSASPGRRGRCMWMRVFDLMDGWKAKTAEAYVYEYALR